VRGRLLLIKPESFFDEVVDGLLNKLLTARLLTPTRTCMMQQRNAFDFLARSISAHRERLYHPSLVNASR